MWSYITTHNRITQHTKLHHTTPYHTTSYHTIPYHTIPHHTIPHHATPYHTTPYHTTPYHTTPYHTISYHITPHPNLQRSFSKSIFADIIYHVYQIQRVLSPRQSWADKYWKWWSTYWTHRIFFCQILGVNRNMK